MQLQPSYVVMAHTQDGVLLHRIAVRGTALPKWIVYFSRRFQKDVVTVTPLGYASARLVAECDHGEVVGLVDMSA